MKVKVLPGMSPSCNRVPINEATEDCPSTTREKRNDIYRIYADRYDNIAMRKRLEISQLFIGRHSTNIAWNMSVFAELVRENPPKKT